MSNDEKIVPFLKPGSFEMALHQAQQMQKAGEIDIALVAIVDKEGNLMIGNTTIPSYMLALGFAERIKEYFQGMFSDED